jgi:uncharacterized membrane protein
MHWSLYALIGAPINAVVNTGYKLFAGQSLWFFAGCVTGITSIVMLCIGLFLYHDKVSSITTGWTPLVIVGMGVTTPLVMFCFISAVTKGPITLVDPLYACLYALASALIGIALLREAPSAMALSGIGLYLVGAALMARG